jgi:hypothetical protein
MYIYLAFFSLSNKDLNQDDNENKNTTSHPLSMSPASSSYSYSSYHSKTNKLNNLEEKLINKIQEDDDEDNVNNDDDFDDEDRRKSTAMDASDFEVQNGECVNKPNELVLLCKLCNKMFDNLHRLQRHMLSHDMNPDLRKFKCDFCNKAFKFKHHLKVSSKLLINE